MFYLDAFQSWRKTPGINQLRQRNCAQEWQQTARVPEDVHQKPDTPIQRSLLLSLAHLPSTSALPACAGYVRHPSSGNQPVQTAQTATTSSKLAEDMQVSLQITLVSTQAEQDFRSEPRANSAPESIVTIKPSVPGPQAAHAG